MQVHEIPRNYKGESRILIFSMKSLVWTAIMGLIGLIFIFILGMFGLKNIGIGISIVFAAIGFCIGTFKFPDTKKFQITRKVGGENIDDVIKRWLNFKRKKNKIYIIK